jgi:hypothetical protein
MCRSACIAPREEGMAKTPFARYSIRLATGSIFMNIG